MATKYTYTVTTWRRKYPKPWRNKAERKRYIRARHYAAGRWGGGQHTRRAPHAPA